VFSDSSAPTTNRPTGNDSAARRGAVCGRADLNERGSALLLVPAGILIVIILAAITVDASLAFMAERSAASIASAAANDAASLAIDIEHFRETGEYKIDPDIAATAEVVAAKFRRAICSYREPCRSG